MSVEAFVQRDRLLTAVGLLAVTGLAWLYLLRESSAGAHGGAPMASAESMESPSAGEAEDLPD